MRLGDFLSTLGTFPTDLAGRFGDFLDKLCDVARGHGVVAAGTTAASQPKR